MAIFLKDRLVPLRASLLFFAFSGVLFGTTLVRAAEDSWGNEEDSTSPNDPSSPPSMTMHSTASTPAAAVAAAAGATTTATSTMSTEEEVTSSPLHHQHQNNKKRSLFVGAPPPVFWRQRSQSPSLYTKLWRARKFPDSAEATAFRQSTRRNDPIFNFKGELWADEKNKPPNPQSPVFFDWVSMLPASERGAYCDVDDPSKADIPLSYTKPTEAAPVALVVPGTNLPRYEVLRDESNYPLAPIVTIGKSSTGVHGRGKLGRWGPNLAGDAVVTRRNPINDKLQVILIKRTDGSGQFAFPGGFVDKEEEMTPERTIIREFLEEAVDVQGNVALRREDDENLAVLRKIFGDGFSIAEVKGRWEVAFHPRAEDGGGGELKRGRVVYAGCMNDERNTDNAWMETVAVNWHIEEPEASKIQLRAGDDATKGSAAFYDVVDDPDLTERGVVPLENLFAAHSAVLRRLLEKFFPKDLPSAERKEEEDVIEPSAPQQRQPPMTK